MGMFLAIPSIIDFYTRCKKHFGVVSDENLPDVVFIEVAFFEIVIRMHTDLLKVVNDRANFEKVIDALFKSLNASDEEIKILHQGRNFSNDIKHLNDEKYKRKFNSWEEGYKFFKISLEIVEKYDLKFSY